MTSMTKTLDCVIIGEEGTLAARCGELLLERGHRLLALLTETPPMVDWARQMAVPCMAPTDMVGQLGPLRFDYLFSIANWTLLGPEVLALAGSGAINYHDSLLPAYAGANATNWALLAGEARHGVSWHRISETIDAGDILQQRQVPIEAGDSAATLNNKCYEAAVASFDRLLSDLAEGRQTAVPQQTDQRRYFSRHRKPEAAGLIDVSASADSVLRLVRACDLGNPVNAFCTAKLALGDTCLMVGKAAAWPLPAGLRAGQVFDVDRDSLALALGDGAIRCTEMRRFDGSAPAIKELLAREAIHEHGQLPDADSQQRQAIDRLMQRFARHEAHWARLLEEVEVFEPLPAPRHAGSGADAERYVSHRLRVGNALPEGLSWSAELACALVGIYFCRLQQRASLTMRVPPAEAEMRAMASSGLFASWLPLPVSAAMDVPLVDALADCTERLRGLLSMGGFMADLPWRYRLLADGAPLRQPLLEVRWEQQGRPLANGVQVQVTDAGRDWLWTVDVWRYDADLAAGMVQRFADWLEQLLASPQASLTAVGLLSGPSLARLQRMGQGSAPAVHAGVPVLARFDHWVRQQPQADALTLGDDRLSYRQLDARANRLARQLLARGVGRGDRVLMLLGHGFDLVTAMLAVHKVGAAYVPLEREHPAERLAAIVHACRPRLLLVAEDDRHPLLSLLGDSPASMPLGDLQSGDATPAGSMPAMGDIAYLLYTSGSTGEPKGVMVSQGNLANYVAWAAATYLQDGPQVFPLFTSIAFDLTLTSIFTPLSTGGSVRIYPSGGDATARVLQVFAEDAVDVIKLTPGQLSLIAAQEGSNRRAHSLILGGEDLLREVACKGMARFRASLHLYNEYGPTEATVGCMLHRFDPLRDNTSSVPIGRPAAGVQLHVLDDEGQPVAPGVTGELYIGGQGVAQGYLHQPALTDERFVRLPVAGDARLFRSGDLARWREDGLLEYLGRRDDQLKLRGYRIETGEITACLLDAAGVGAAAVVARDLNHQPSTAQRHYCQQCGLPDSHPKANLDSRGLCQPCREFESQRVHLGDYFRPRSALQAEFDARRQAGRGNIDCLMLYSGGKDSTYALYQLVREMGLKVLVYTFDNGYISDQAMSNIRNAVADLAVELVVGRTDSIDAIYVDSLQTHHTVCNGCFKTIYTLGLNLARERGIGVMVTGMSRGQIFETRLADLYAQGVFDADEIERAVIQARRVYHDQDDAVSRLLDVSYARSAGVFDEVRIIDYYRYDAASVDEIYQYIYRHVPWIKPRTGGCSTNCVINDAGIYVHHRSRGWHNYAWPNSWEVRLGLKTREEAIAELQAPIDEGEALKILDRIGYRPARQARDLQLIAYYSSDDGKPVQGLRQHLARRLPEYMIPSHLLHLPGIPLTANGKLDRDQLPVPGGRQVPLLKGGAPRGDAEGAIAELWRELLRVDAIGRLDSFFELGGHSLLAARFLGRLQQRLGIRLPLHSLVEGPTVAALAARVTRLRRGLDGVSRTEAGPDAGVVASDREEGEL
jgi:amino acid adenylation domain-containing protein